MKFINGYIYIGDKIKKQNFAIINDKITFKNLNKIKKFVNLKGKVVSPGFVDLHIHTRVPGFEYKEDLKHIDKSLIAGGFTHAVAQSNVDPAPWNVNTLKQIQKMLDKMNVNVLQAGRITHNNKITNMEEMSKETKLFSDDGDPVKYDNQIIAAIKLAKKTDSTLMLHQEDYLIKGKMYDCTLSKTLKLPSFNCKYETNNIKRDIKINKYINAKLHIQHISTDKSIEIIAKAIFNGMNLTAEITPHHLFFDNENIKNHGNYKMNPPLPKPEWKKKLIEAFKNKVINIIATDHAPHTPKDKEGGFHKAVNGIIGLETSFAAVNTIAKKNQIPLETVLEAMSINPSKILNINNNIKEGAIANLTVIDPNEKWIFGKKDIKSKSFNSPFIGVEFIGKVKWIILKGEKHE